VFVWVLLSSARTCILHHIIQAFIIHLLASSHHGTLHETLIRKNERCFFLRFKYASILMKKKGVLSPSAQEFFDVNEKKGVFAFGSRMLRCERKEGKVFFAFGSKNDNTGLIHSIGSNDRRKVILQGIHKSLQNITLFDIFLSDIMFLNYKKELKEHLSGLLTKLQDSLGCILQDYWDTL
jgi:hypothetical protein